MELMWSDPANEIFAALATAQSEIENVAKDSTNPHFKTNYASLAAVLSVARPALAKNGIGITQIPGTDANGAVTVMTALVHSSGQWIRGEMACSIDKNSRSTAQGIGTVISYLRRYSLAAITGIAQMDDDAESASMPMDSAPRAQPSRSGERAASPRTQSGPPLTPEERAEKAAAFTNQIATAIQEATTTADVNVVLADAQRGMDALRASYPDKAQFLDDIASRKRATLAQEPPADERAA